MEKPNSINLDWITKGIEPETVTWTEDFAQYLAEGREKLTTSQLRKFFGELKRIQAIGYGDKTKVDFVMLKAKLAYAAGRAIKNKRHGKISDFKDELSKGIDVVNSKESFKNFTNIVESIVAYHKVYENLN
jgi:CRISPR type III-A-associated protein Csm2